MPSDILRNRTRAQNRGYSHGFGGVTPPSYDGIDGLGEGCTRVCQQQVVKYAEPACVGKKSGLEFDRILVKSTRHGGGYVDETTEGSLVVVCSKEKSH